MDIKPERQQNFEECFKYIKSKASITFKDWNIFEEWYGKVLLYIHDLKKQKEKWKTRALDTEKKLNIQTKSKEV